MRARRDAGKAVTPALQRVMDAVPGEGPLGLLRRCYAARATTRVRVVTRHRRGVRGVATGARQRMHLIWLLHHVIWAPHC